MVSEPLDLNLPAPLHDLVRDKERFSQVVDDHQEKLKEIGDWKILPMTIEMIAEGRFSMDKTGMVHVDRSPVPEGFRRSPHT